MKLNHLNRRLRLHESEYTVRPKTKKELVEIIKATISEEGNKCDLNFIDVSRIKDMSSLFSDEYGLDLFKGDISEWDVSNVEDMSGMFAYSKFNQDISDWDVSNVKDMSRMFAISDFNQDISDWDVSSVINMCRMFADSKFNQDISDWDISNVRDTEDMFKNAKIKDSYKPQLKTNESNHLNRFSNRTSRRSLTESRNRISSNLRRFI
jgi:surface protein